MSSIQEFKKMVPVDVFGQVSGIFIAVNSIHIFIFRVHF